MTIVIRQAASMAKEDLDQLGEVKVPLSSPAALLVGRKYLNDVPGIDSMGIWECSPGRWQRTIMEEEFAHFINGSARFVPEDGSDPIDLRAGDTIWFPANSRGVWEISEDVRKVYVIIDRPNILKRAKAWAKQMLSVRGHRAAESTAPVRAVPVTANLADGRSL
jgi:uncharacterized cupin superfamily protein